MPNGALAISLRDGDKTPSQLAFAAVLSRYWLFAFFVFPGIGLFSGMAVLSLRGTPWFPHRRYAGNPTFKQHNKVSPPLGHWNPETLEPRVEAPGHWNLGTLEPQVHREEKGHRPENRERAPTRGTVFLFSGTPLGSHWRSLRCAFHCRAAHGGYDVLGGARWLQVQFLVSFFPETKGRRVPIIVGRELFKHCVLGELCPCTSNLFGCSSIPPVPIWESATIWRLSSQDGRRLDAQASDHLFGGRVTCSETQTRHALRPPVRRLTRRVHRRLIRQPTRSTECEKGRAEVLGTFSARTHRECKVQCGVCDCGRHALRAGRQLASAYRDVSQRPTHKKGHDTRQLLYTAPAPYPVVRSFVHSFIHSFIHSFTHSSVTLKHARNGHALCDTKHYTALAQQSSVKHKCCLQLPHQPPRMFLRRCPASALRSSSQVAAVALFCAGVRVLWQRGVVVHFWSLLRWRRVPTCGISWTRLSVLMACLYEKLRSSDGRTLPFRTECLGFERGL